MLSFIGLKRQQWKGRKSCVWLFHLDIRPWEDYGPFAELEIDDEVNERFKQSYNSTNENTPMQ